MALSQVGSYSQWILTAFLKCPSQDSLIMFDSGVSCVIPVHTLAPGHSLRPCQLHLGPVSR